MMLLNHCSFVAPVRQNSVLIKGNAIDRQIDVLVYELYGLTDEEIRVVEGGE